jgi:hypothetical protein
MTMQLGSTHCGPWRPAALRHQTRDRPTAEATIAPALQVHRVRGLPLLEMTRHPIHSILHTQS